MDEWFPPTADPTQPYSSLPCLAAFLRDRGRHTVDLIDANVVFFRAILTRSTLTDARDRVRERLVRLEQQNRLPPGDAKWYARAVQALVKSPFIIDGVVQAAAAISRAETFSSIERLNDCKRTLHEAAELLSCAWTPISFRLGSASDLHFATSADVSLLVDNIDNPFGDVLKKRYSPGHWGCRGRGNFHHLPRSNSPGIHTLEPDSSKTAGDTRYFWRQSTLDMV